MSTVAQEHVKKVRDKVQQITSPEEAQASIAVLPLQAVYEARWALQQLKEQFSAGEQDKMFEILEPLARCIGGYEMLVFQLDTNTQREAIKTLAGNGTQVSRSGR